VQRGGVRCHDLADEPVGPRAEAEAVATKAPSSGTLYAVAA
jgi:hypothetical protein